MNATDDRELLAAVAAGDRRALRDLYDRHAPWLTLRLQRRCARPRLVDDAVQDTFVAVWRTARRYDGQGEVGAWIWGIGVRRLIDALRRRPRREFASARARSRSCRRPRSRCCSASSTATSAGALNRLSPELRAVVQATVLDGLTTQEAGQLLGSRPERSRRA